MSEKSKQQQEDAATFWSVLAAAFASSRVGREQIEPCTANVLARVTDGNPLLLLAVIRATRVSVAAWLFQPWNAWRVTRFQSLLATDDKNREMQLESVLKVFRAATMVRYGVVIGHQHYRKLRGLAVDGVLAEKRLARLLSYPTVWWGTDYQPAASDGLVIRWLKRAWVMGRPRGGELLVARFSLFTRTILSLAAYMTIGLLLYVVYAVISILIRFGPAPEAAVFAFFAAQLAFLAAGLLWLGPSADRAARELSSLLDPKPRIVA